MHTGTACPPNRSDPHADKTLHDLSKAMRDLDFCMLTTGTGVLTSRPMSNNGDVEYDGDSWFYAYVGLGQDPGHRAGSGGGTELQRRQEPARQAGIFIGIEGTHAELIRDKAQFEAHWTRVWTAGFPRAPTRPA